jgi:hypothetical protein
MCKNGQVDSAKLGQRLDHQKIKEKCWKLWVMRRRRSNVLFIHHPPYYHVDRQHDSMGGDGWKVALIYGWKVAIIYEWKVTITHGWKVAITLGWKVTITHGWKVAITHLEIFAKLISSEWIHLYTQTIFWSMKSSTHPSRSFTNEKEEIVQSDLQSLPNRIECDHMDDIYFVKQLKIQKP